MGKSTRFLVICTILAVTHITLSSITAVDATSGAHHFPLFPSPSTCRGSIAECLAEDSSDLEFDMDSDINRRILAVWRRHISYGALSRNTVPCSRRGASYYNCRPGAHANPYSRGCSAITRCHR